MDLTRCYVKAFGYPEFEVDQKVLWALQEEYELTKQAPRLLICMEER